uniref:RNA helicase n=1 Tax=Tanacetum cinerariifolium TaxID=118510 RepID=A0A6L2MQD3_TANCI|nr:DEAD-box ATP-dependent RNA helicase 35 [Tanacetum cinerariifolium]
MGEEVETWKLYLRIAFTISTLERVTIGCCEVDGGGGDGGDVFGGGVFGGSVVFGGDGVGNRVIGVVCGGICLGEVGVVRRRSAMGEVKVPISTMIVRVPEKDRWCGRHMIGIAFTGSGKTLVFVLPLIMIALQEEIMVPIAAGESPLGLIICPSKELARQTYEVIEEFLIPLKESGYPEIRPLLCVGGVDMRSQLDVVKRGVHIVVATPGRLKDLLAKKRMNLNNCSALVKPVTVNVCRAGAANLDVIQKLEYVKQKDKFVYLLECIKKTVPPVIVFCENKADVDASHEFLLIKGMEAVAIHGGKDQEERSEEPEDVGKQELPRLLSTSGYPTSICRLDLKHLLQEAKQRIPPVLAELNDPMEDIEAIANASGVKGCTYCGGLDHRITDCPKLELQKSQQIAGSRRDYFGSGG